MTAQERLFLLFTVLLSLLIWGLMVSPKFGLVIVSSILIHEYGHYYWMGAEGIKNRSMMMLPPFGALALAKDLWPTRGSEARIAVAGPIAGLLPALMFYFAWTATGNETWKAAAFLASVINLFNLIIPVSIMDGGRIIKSILFSVDKRLGVMFYGVSFVALLAIPLVLQGGVLVTIILAYMTWRDYETFRESPKELSRKKLILEHVRGIENSGMPEEFVVMMLKSLDFPDKNTLEKSITNLEKFVNPPTMSGREITVSLILYATVTASHAWLAYQTNMEISDIYRYFL